MSNSKDLSRGLAVEKKCNPTAMIAVKALAIGSVTSGAGYLETLVRRRFYQQTIIKNLVG